MRTVLIINPASGVSPLAETQHDSAESTESAEEMVLAALRTYDIEPEVWHTTLEDPGTGLAQKAADEHVDLVIAAGGDGTIHAVARGLVKRETALAIIPMGTMNNLAHSLGIPLPLEAACAIIAKGETRALDVGIINDKTFLEVAGIGLEAALFPAAEEIKSPKFFSMVRGVINGLSILFAFKPTKLKISFDDKKRRQYQAIQVTICNAPFYGAHFQIASNVLMDDGLLDVVIYKTFSKFEYFRHAISITQGRRVYQPKITHRRVKSLRISTEHPVEIQADGLAQGYTPAVVRVAPGVLRVRVPTTNVPGLEEASSFETNPDVVLNSPTSR